MGKKGENVIRERVLTPLHDMREIRGAYSELMLKENYEGTATDDYIHVVLTDEMDVPNAMDNLRVVYRNIMKLSYDNKRTRLRQDLTNVSDAEMKTPIELFSEFYEKQNNQEMTERQREFVSDCINVIWEENV